MRLTDADALKKAILNHCRSEIEAINHFWYDDTIITLIDNAPTVPLPDFKEGYKQAIIDGETNFSRPQGEWINTYEGDLYCTSVYKCSKCGRKVKIEYPDDISDYPFCHCGAKMKGGAE